MIKQKKIIKFRRAMYVFWLSSLKYKLDNGDLDWAIEQFLDGANLEINTYINLTANDIIFMNTLMDGQDPSKEIIEKWKKLKAKGK